jgi:formate dehydrogenase major subunit
VASATITLNGREVAVEPGATILDAARAHGVEIPTLCHDEQLEPFGSCWLCAVRIEGVRRYVPACATRVAGGMKIWTDTDDVRAVRRMALELLLSNHRGDCVAPCRTECPAGVDVQGYIALIAQGQHREASKLVKRVNPFPLSIGRVCPRPCEKECRRNAVDGPVGIDHLKRFAADWDADHDDPYVPPAAPPTGKRVAMVGAGPASLTAAYYLAQKGHEVTVFEALPHGGGALRYGIPEFRLPKTVLDRDIGLITALGIKVVYGRALGRDFTITDLFEQGFGAVFLGLGAVASRKMEVTGEELSGVWSGTEFLTDVALGKPVKVGRRVAVVGGGNTAIDAARTCVRLGAEKVTIVYRRSRNEMPAWDVEVEAAEHEGVQMHFLAAPTAIEGERACGLVTCIRMDLGEPDASGRRRPVAVAGSEFKVEADTVIAAIGQYPDLSALRDTGAKDPDSPEAKLALTKWGTIVADEETLVTSVPGVFAGGDVVNGAATAIEAIAAGGKAAAAIDRLLRGEDITLRTPFFNIRKERWDALPADDLEHVERKPRQPMRELAVADRRTNFEEVELGYTEQQALEEATRCLECGCIATFDCRLRHYAAEYGASSDAFEGESLRESPDERHPFIRIEPEKCILCARCVRICEEVQGASALGFFRRGFAAQMTPGIDQPLAETTCESCGQCVTTCPTAALTARADAPKPGPWELEKRRSTCTFCGTGCAVDLNTVGGRLVLVTPGADNLCVRGRFGFTAASDRLSAPLVRRGRGLSEAGWDECLDAMARGLGAAAREGGPGAVAVFGSPRLTNEEAYRLKELAGAGAVGAPNVSSFGLAVEDRAFGALRRALGRAASTASYADVEAADTLLLIDSDIAEEQTVAANAVRKGVRRGARLIVVSPDETRMARLADTWVRVERDRIGAFLAAAMLRLLPSVRKDPAALPYRLTGLDGLEKAASDIAAGAADPRADAVASALARPGRAVLVANAVAFDPASIDRDAALAVALAAVAGKAFGRGSGILMLRMRANGQGLSDVGFVTDAARLFGDMERGLVRAALIVGEDPVAGASDPGRVRAALSKLSFLGVLDAVSTRTTELAGVVLPVPAFAETNGSFTSSERRVQLVQGPLPPPGGLSTLEVLGGIAGRLGVPPSSTCPADVRAEMAVALAGLDFPAALGRDGHRLGGDLLYGTGPGTPDGGVGLAIPDAVSPEVLFDPRFSDAIEVLFASHAQDLGLRSHVVRPWRVSA